MAITQPMLHRRNALYLLGGVSIARKRYFLTLHHNNDPRKQLPRNQPKSLEHQS